MKNGTNAPPAGVTRRPYNRKHGRHTLLWPAHAQATTPILTREGQDVMSGARTTASDGVPTNEVIVFAYDTAVVVYQKCNRKISYETKHCRCAPYKYRVKSFLHPVPCNPVICQSRPAEYRVFFVA